MKDKTQFETWCLLQFGKRSLEYHWLTDSELIREITNTNSLLNELKAELDARRLWDAKMNAALCAKIDAKNWCDGDHLTPVQDILPWGREA